ncbi:MAG: DUF262 domain-containing HNH endonuclease family protein [Actinomycetia bacterium]|nr:DUF262 domain-containing HNH endonuclease family protein [Actinomycetes bacterium]
MAMHKEIGFEHKGIGEVLAHNRLIVPLNQREYSWEDEHVRDLFQDFAGAIAGDKGTYFLGTIVLTKGEGEFPEVSDGQQRLATTTILIAAIRDHFAVRGDSERASSLENEFLLTTDFKTTNIVPRLRLNVDDNEFFMRRVLKRPGTKERNETAATKESHNKLQRAAEIAEEHVRSILAPHKEAAHVDRLVEWVDFVRSGALVILLKVPDHLNAFMMFETLNDRGLKASQADLIKNHLLSHAKGRIAEAQSKWSAMTGVLESLDEDDITVLFLHHYLITQQGPTKAREVFEKVRTQIDSESRSLDFLEEVSTSALDYAALFNPDHKKWNEYGTATRKHITTINRDLRVKQIRPLMFAVARHFAVSEAKLAFRMFVCWSVRFIIAGGRGGLLDLNYSQRAQQVASGQIKTAAQLAASMATVVPSDVEFAERFSEARVSQVHLARYYLRALEMKKMGSSEPELTPSDDEQAVNLEHVLPQNPGTNWPQIDNDTAAANYKRIGNMVLMQATKNVLVGNSAFDDKKPVLAQSEFLLTSEVAEQTTWGPLQIAERQRKLADLAVETWPTKP